MLPCPTHLQSQIIEHATDSVICTDAAGEIEWVNEQFCKLTGYELDEIKGRKPGAFLQGEATDTQVVRNISDALKSARPVTAELVNYHKNGSPYWVELTITPLHDETGRLINFISIERDVTRVRALLDASEKVAEEHKQKRDELSLIGQMSNWLFSTKSVDELSHVTTQSLQSIFPQTSGGIYLYSNSRDTLELINGWGNSCRNSKQIKPDGCWGLRRGKSYAYGLRDISIACDHCTPGELPPNVYACLPIIAHGEAIGLLRIEFEDQVATQGGLDKDDQNRLEQRVQLAQICVEQISLATAMVQLQEELHDKSVKDLLTGLWNRRWFLDMATRELQSANEYDHPVSIAMIDVDYFKRFNDEHGHDAGDTVLKMLASHMMEMRTHGIYPARFGGEEFVVLFVDKPKKEVLGWVNALRADIQSDSIIYMGERLPSINFSAGVVTAELARRSSDLRNLISCADRALYDAKKAGRGRTLYFDHQNSRDSNGAQAA